MPRSNRELSVREDKKDDVNAKLHKVKEKCEGAIMDFG